MAEYTAMTLQDWRAKGERHLARYRELAARPICSCDYLTVISGQADNCQVKREYGQHNSVADRRYFEEIIAFILADMAEIGRQIIAEEARNA